MKTGVQKRIRFGIKQKTIASILIAGSLPLILGLGFIYFQGTAQLRKAIGANFEGLATETARNVDLIIDYEIAKTKQLSRSPEVRKASRESNRRYKGLSEKELEKQLSQAENRWLVNPKDSSNQNLFLGLTGDSLLEELLASVRENPVYLAFFITDQKGALIASINHHPDFLNTGKSWWQKSFQLDENQVFISNLYFHEKANVYAIDMAMPIREEAGTEPIGILKVDYNISEFLKPAIYPVRFGETGHAMLIDSSGDVLICPILPTGAHFADVSLVSAVSSPFPGWTIAESDGHGGKNSIIGFSPLEGYNNLVARVGGHKWHSFIRQDPKELYVPIQNLLKWIALSGTLSMVVLGMLGYYAANRIVKPISKLQEGTTLIADGKLNQPLDIRTGDEIEQLADSFEKMNRKLSESFSILEQKVEERTRELKESQAKLLQSEKLASMGEVSASIGHELRNPLSVIKNSTYYLKTKIKDDPKLLKHLNIVDKEILACETIIGDLLNFTQSREPVTTLSDIHLMINEAVDAIEVQSGITVNKVFDPQMVPFRVDPDKIRRVFINIIMNAFQAMDSGGTLTISTRKKQGTAEIEFSDTGKGIAPAHLENIFKPFFTTRAKGIGLGLAVSKKSVEEHRGRINLESEPGKGTKFTVALPITT